MTSKTNDRPVRLNFRQVHLDFHTSEHIAGIGAAFDENAFVATLVDARVQTVNLFAKCHHGYAYYETEVGIAHPHLEQPLLERQVAALHGAGIETQIYLSVAWDDWVRQNRPQWRQTKPDGGYYDMPPSFLTPTVQGEEMWQPAWASICLNSPYLDYLVAQIEEVVIKFPGTAGIWLDIVHQRECCCRYCRRDMEARGLDWSQSPDRQAFSRIVLEQYYARTFNAVRKHAPGMRVVHNQGLPRGDQWRLEYFSHYELESLPTGGWGYDHFPFCVRYLENCGLPYLGMTGKFHLSWGEFGAFKTAAALRYECAAMLAHGARICIGDQLHPLGKPDAATYRLIGEAYSEVEAREPWCTDTCNVADVAILSSLAVKSPGASSSLHGAADEDDGAGRILLQGHLLFTVIDQHMDFSPYRVMILPDHVRLDGSLKDKLVAYLQGGGKLLLSYESGLWSDSDRFALDIGAELVQLSPLETSFAESDPPLAPDSVTEPVLFRQGTSRVVAKGAVPLARLYDPYFQRTAQHFCGHQHAPPRDKASDYCAALRHGNCLYLSHPVFSEYKRYGTLLHKFYVLNALAQLLGEDGRLSIEGLPSEGRVILRHQPEARRYVLHLLYGPRQFQAFSPIGPVEVIEELPAIHNIRIGLNLEETLTSVTLEPQGEALAYQFDRGMYRFAVAGFSCHQMIALQY